MLRHQHHFYSKKMPDKLNISAFSWNNQRTLQGKLLPELWRDVNLECPSPDLLT